MVAIEAACKPADEYNKETCPINLPQGFIRFKKLSLGLLCLRFLKSLKFLTINLQLVGDWLTS